MEILTAGPVSTVQNKNYPHGHFDTPFPGYVSGRKAWLALLCITFSLVATEQSLWVYNKLVLLRYKDKFQNWHMYIDILALLSVH
jgi:hypothetical protein